MAALPSMFCLKAPSQVNRLTMFARAPKCRARSKVGVSCAQGKAEYLSQHPAAPQIEEVRRMLCSMKDGTISPSAYDIAWVARIPSLINSDEPEFPECLNWIRRNQQADGSWGDNSLCPNLYDKILNTLSCVLTLKIWNLSSTIICKGMEFLAKNIKNLQDDQGNLPSGFELIFPSMLEEAKYYGLSISDEHSFLEKMETMRKIKLEKIPLNIIHAVPTTILYTLEGVSECIRWNDIMHLQSSDGSFLTCPSSTACTYLHTKDHKCLDYLRKVVQSFDGAVPGFYPLDLFERLWVVDTIQRLGIGHLFVQEINEILAYVHNYWSDNGIGWARNNSVQDIDDTAMAFRLLRLNGYIMKPDAFTKFTLEGRFFCFRGERYHGSSEMLNLYRASQVAFPGEDVLDRACAYSRHYLMQQDNLVDKWSTKKNLPSEVNFELSNSWSSCLPRIYAKWYIGNYGTDDVWLGKTIYRLPNVNNPLFLSIAKADFNRCQESFQDEGNHLLRWCADLELEMLLSASKRVKTLQSFVLRMHSLIASCMFEPEFSFLRLTYTKICILIMVCDDLADHGLTPLEFHKFINMLKRWDPPNGNSSEIEKCFNAIYQTMNKIIAQASIEQKKDVGPIIRNLFIENMEAILTDAEGLNSRGYEEYIRNGEQSTGVGLLIIASSCFCGVEITHKVMDMLMSSKELQLASRIVRLSNDLATYQEEENNSSAISAFMNDHPKSPISQAIKHVHQMIEEHTKELTMLYLTPSEIPQCIKRLVFENVRMGLFNYANGGDMVRIPDQGKQELMYSVTFEAVH